VRSGFAGLPDHRLDDTELSLTEALRSAFAMFSLQAPSLLAFDKERAEGHLPTIYGIERVPCDTYMRAILDPVSPKLFRPVFQSVFRQLQRGKALEPMACLAGHSLLARAGTGYFSSQTIHCASCLQKGHRNGAITYFHQMLGAAIMHPDIRAVMPLMPAPMVRHDGTAKNDGERTAATRVVGKLRRDHPPLQCIVPEASLSSHAPHLETLHADGLRYLLGVKEGDHAYLFQQVQAAEHAGRVTYYERHDRAAGVLQRFRLVNAMPRNASHTDVRVNCLAYWEQGADKVQPCSWVTDLRVSTRHVYHLMRGGRARWKIANETCNTLQNQGYHFEPNYGHGTQHLSVVCAILRLLAFVVDQAQQRCCALFQAVWAKLGSKRLLWERRRARFYDYAFASMRQLFEALWYGFKKSRPLVTLDASSSVPLLRRLRAVARDGLLALGATMPPGRERSAFNKTACDVASRKFLQKTGKGMVDPLTELSISLVA
jgi:hypothetical protein